MPLNFVYARVCTFAWVTKLSPNLAMIAKSLSDICSQPLPQRLLYVNYITFSLILFSDYSQYCYNLMLRLSSFLKHARFLIFP